MIKLPPDGRMEVGGQIEAMLYGLEESVIRYLNMRSVGERLAGELKILEAVASQPVLRRVLGLSPPHKSLSEGDPK